jgi:hypothetical protein
MVAGAFVEKSERSEGANQSLCWCLNDGRQLNKRVRKLVVREKRRAVTAPFLFRTPTATAATMTTVQKIKVTTYVLPLFPTLTSKLGPRKSKMRW